MLMPQSHKQKKIYIGGYNGQLCEIDFDKRTLLRQVKIHEKKIIFLFFFLIRHHLMKVIVLY
jgi:hypothetical protein